MKTPPTTGALPTSLIQTISLFTASNRKAIFTWYLFYNDQSGSLYDGQVGINAKEVSKDNGSKGRGIDAQKDLSKMEVVTFLPFLKQ